MAMKRCHKFTHSSMNGNQLSDVFLTVNKKMAQSRAVNSKTSIVIEASDASIKLVDTNRAKSRTRRAWRRQHSGKQSMRARNGIKVGDTGYSSGRLTTQEIAQEQKKE